MKKYRCDNPKCIIGFFTKDEGSCPYCGSKEYHSFETSINDLKKVINDLIRK